MAYEKKIFENIFRKFSLSVAMATNQIQRLVEDYSRNISVKTITDMAWYMVWPGGHGMVYGMAWRAWQDRWYGLADMSWYMVWPGRHGIVYDMAWRAWHGIWYGLAGKAWYMVWPGVYGIVHDMD